MTYFGDGGARLHVAVRGDADQLTITLTGELDRVSGPPLADVLVGAMDTGVRSVWVSMAQVGFVDVAGVRVLVDAYEAGAGRGVVLQLRDPQPHIVWLLQETEAAHLLSAQAAPVRDLGRRIAPHGDAWADERDRLLRERQQRTAEHQRWEDVREDLADARERDLDRREDRR
ncbi:STAS domain-containing protein [Actinoplanes sp. NPDC049548]|uniref:STAS domain-containing protein n=1 Tax=Actinoplanes sp. NPDC049548 TaxID=3155152 RepID=UPI003423476D